MGQKIFYKKLSWSFSFLLIALLPATAFAAQGPAEQVQRAQAQIEGQEPAAAPAEQQNAEQQDELGDPEHDVVVQDGVPGALEEFPGEEKIYGDFVVCRRTGTTQFISDIIMGCTQNWDERRFLAVIHAHLDDGVHIDKACKEERTPLMYACWYEAPLCVIQALVDAGGSIRRCKDRGGRTALRYACQPNRPHYDVIKLFLDAGARADVVDEDGGTPFDYVWRNPNADQRVKDLLLERYQAELQAAERDRIVCEQRRVRRAARRGELPELLEEKEFSPPDIIIKKIR